MTVREYNKFPCYGVSRRGLIVKFDIWSKEYVTYGIGTVVKQGSTQYKVGFKSKTWDKTMFEVIKVTKVLKYNV